MKEGVERSRGEKRRGGNWREGKGEQNTRKDKKWLLILFTSYHVAIFVFVCYVSSFFLIRAVCHVWAVYDSLIYRSTDYTHISQPISLLAFLIAILYPKEDSTFWFLILHDSQAAEKFLFLILSYLLHNSYHQRLYLLH